MDAREFVIALLHALPPAMVALAGLIATIRASRKVDRLRSDLNGAVAHEAEARDPPAGRLRQTGKARGRGKVRR